MGFSKKGFKFDFTKLSPRLFFNKDGMYLEKSTKILLFCIEFVMDKGLKF